MVSGLRRMSSWLMRWRGGKRGLIKRSHSCWDSRTGMVVGKSFRTRRSLSVRYVSISFKVGFHGLLCWNVRVCIVMIVRS